MLKSFLCSFFTQPLKCYHRLNKICKLVNKM